MVFSVCPGPVPPGARVSLTIDPSGSIQTARVGRQELDLGLVTASSCSIKFEMVEPVSIRLMKSGSGRVTVKPWAWSSLVDVLRRETMNRTYQQRRRIFLEHYNDLGMRDWRLRPSETKQIRHIIRIDPGMLPTPPPGWERQIVQSWRPWNYEPDVTNMKLEPRPTSPSVSRGSGGWWEGAGRGLPLGAALLAAILLLLRAADRCLHTNLFKLPIRRRQSEEWPTPNVLATSLAVQITNDFNTIIPPSPPMQSDELDLPPPYAECATRDAPDLTATSSRPKTEQEEPPPPYSACYVSYSNPKDGQPSVQFLTPQCQNLFSNNEGGSSGVHDTGQSSEVPSQEVINWSDLTGSQSECDLAGGVYSESSDNDSEVELKQVTCFSRGKYRV